MKDRKIPAVPKEDRVKLHEGHEPKKMEVRFADSFGKSLKKLINTKIWYKWAFWEDKYYELKWDLWALRKYFHVTRKMRPWDYGCILEMTKHHLELLKENLKTSPEVDESRLPKIERMGRVIELIHNVREDNHSERCGYINHEIEFEKIDKVDEEGNNFYQIKEHEHDDHNFKAITDGRELFKKEWDEIFEILKDDLQGWWN